MKVRVRFGIKTGSWIFPNAAVFVFRMPLDKFETLNAAVTQLRAALPAKWGGSIVLEGEAV
jgi:hypothetical protein